MSVARFLLSIVYKTQNIILRAYLMMHVCSMVKGRYTEGGGALHVYYMCTHEVFYSHVFILDAVYLNSNDLLVHDEVVITSLIAPNSSAIP